MFGGLFTDRPVLFQRAADNFPLWRCTALYRSGLNAEVFIDAFLRIAVMKGRCYTWTWLPYTGGLKRVPTTPDASGEPPPEVDARDERPVG